MHTVTPDARCVGYFKVQGGQGSGLANGAKISWRKTQTLRNWAPATKDTMHKWKTTHTLPSAIPLNPKSWGSEPGFDCHHNSWAKSGLVLWFRSNNTNLSYFYDIWAPEQKSWDCLFLWSESMEYRRLPWTYVYSPKTNIYCWKKLTANSVEAAWDSSNYKECFCNIVLIILSIL